MSEWPLVRLGSVTDLRSGFAFKSQQWRESGVPVVKIRNVKQGRLDLEGCSYVSNEDAIKSNFMLTQGDILIGLTGYVGSTCIVKTKEPLALNQRVGIFRPDARKIHPAFLYFLIADEDFRLRVAGAAYGSAQPNVSPRQILDFEVQIPPLGTQRAVAALLGALDDKIELNRRMSATLEEMARALYRSWFVDFDPVHARALGQPPAHMDPTTAALFPDRFGENGLPKGWEMSTIGKELEILDSKRVPLSKQQRQQRSGIVPYYGATSVMDFVDQHIFDEVLLLVGEDGSVAKPDGRPFTQYIWGKAWVNNHAHVLKGKKYSVEQLKCYFETTSVAEFITGAVQMKLSQGNMKKIPWVEAPSQIHNAFDAITCSWFDRVRALVEETNTLAALRDALLPRLMSGEIRIRDAEKQVDEVI
ncbi:restriction endonuclease subunit S [Paracoccus sp. 1_MG-2023]|uniref:restriction endonuclease subunit S n=1 Tax=unclassified Paracoccus (in: a-proteobacteria) TaxID=2688777 RepID=UPI001C08FEDE|nr:MULTISPECIES: restriction endonuclease subunit S [unclassified Paracoccus (in: a-proteobacteria)]MBU2957160.1 restriction endonuclease subunit S [Paracoccus sp. C2R09]MDO6670337.1 restriction endonuclease subunit S [Paracoccus sp. 1_MG-2023]